MKYSSLKSDNQKLKELKEHNKIIELRCKDCNGYVYIEKRSENIIYEYCCYCQSKNIEQDNNPSELK